MDTKISFAEKQKKVTEIVKNCMISDEVCRNDDLWLIINVWRWQGIKIYVDYKKMKQLITPESITRARRKIQETELEATDPEVIKKRRKRQKNFHDFYIK